MTWRDRLTQKAEFLRAELTPSAERRQEHRDAYDKKYGERDAAAQSLAEAQDNSHRHYEWMVEKYVGRDRSIPGHVPEMREDDRLNDEVYARKQALAELEERPAQDRER